MEANTDGMGQETADDLMAKLAASMGGLGGADGADGGGGEGIAGLADGEMEAMIAKMAAGLEGGGEGGDEGLGIMEQMMEHLLAKDVLYPSLLEIAGTCPFGLGLGMPSQPLALHPTSSLALHP
jgi:hypothetical protein